MRLGIDVGGTFTDLVAEDESGKLWKVKVSTTPEAPDKGVLEAVRSFLKDSGIAPGRVKIVLHATTLASNALLSGKGPKTALVTTEGFRDVLEIARQNRPELYNLQVERITPLIPRRYRFEVPERIGYDGSILHSIDLDKTRKLAKIIRKLGVESVAICFLHSYANPKHERLAARIIEDELPDAFVSVSSGLLPEFREYERTSTTVVNAVLQPIVSHYLTRLETALREQGIRAPFFVMQSNGGTILSSQASVEPARIIESGPVAGAVASQHYRARRDEGLMSLDVGGTTSKAGVWFSGKFETTTEYEVGGRVHGVRRLEGSGYPVRFPFVDLVEVGTGGGSIAWVDGERVLHVGPESAGAVPGPACYGKGGTRPTLTDANIALGRLSSDYLLGGELKVDRKLAERALKDHVGRSMEVGLNAAASGILRLGIANIAGALRAASVERGHDPREMTLIAFGGAGPMHACEVALQLAIPRVLIPPSAGLFSSLGLLLSEPVHDFVRTMLGQADNVDSGSAESDFQSLERRGVSLLRMENVPEASVLFERFLDLRYRGQAYELAVRIPSRQVSHGVVAKAVQEFHREHERRYGYSDKQTPVELVNIRVYCKTRSSRVLPTVERGPFRHTSPKVHRRVFLGDSWHENCPVFERRVMGVGLKGKGPCIVEDYDSTLVIPSGPRFEIDRTGAFRIQLFN